MSDTHIHNGDAGLVAQCLQCGHDFTVTHPDERFCSEKCASDFMAGLGMKALDLPQWAGWTGRVCACGCGLAVTPTWAGQTHVPGHEKRVPCSHCGRPFEPSDGRNTVCGNCRRDRQSGPREPIKCGGCGRMFVPTDGRQKYCPDCAVLPIAQRKNQTRACPTCGTRFFPVHGPIQLHCRQECAWPAAWNGPQVGAGLIIESSVMPQNS